MKNKQIDMKETIRYSITDLWLDHTTYYTEVQYELRAMPLFVIGVCVGLIIGVFIWL